MSHGRSGISSRRRWELTGATIPAGFKPDGQSLVSIPERRTSAAPAITSMGTARDGHGFDSGNPLRRLESVRNGPSKPTSLYDLKTDSAETKNVAAEHAEIVARAEALMKSAHVDDPNWPMKDPPVRTGSKKSGKKAAD
jgi:hypothetical protein